MASSTTARDIARERMRVRREALSVPPCPHCGNVPAEGQAQLQQQQDLTTSWLESDRSGEIVERHHCVACQPGGQIAPTDCGLCDNGPILVGDLAAELTELDRIPEPVRRWLLDHG
jgi:hypothetical protein